MASKGHVFLAQNSSTDYIRQAYALALSIKVHNREYDQTCLITNDPVPEEYLHAFDHIVPIPWKDAAEGSQWKIENRWKIIYATPFDENIVYDVDMILNSTNDHWWKYLKEKDFAFTSSVKNYRGNVVVDDYYRKMFTENSLPNIYTGIFYFRKVKNSYEFFKWLETIVNNWKYFYKKYSPNSRQTFCSLDVSAALAIKLMQNDLEKVPILTFVHMKPRIQEWRDIPSKWTNVLNVSFRRDGRLIVGNYRQNDVFHYVEDEFLTDDIIEKLEDLYAKKI
jgi:hypothetical protein